MKYFTEFKIPKYTAKTVEGYNYYIKNIYHSDIDYLYFICEGTGKIYDKNDPPDIYEGNKLRRRVCCTACNGTKKDKKEFIKRFKILISILPYF